MHVETGADGYQDKTPEQILEEFDDSDDGLPTMKRRHVPVSEALTPEQEQTLVDWFSENPLFFDQT